MNIIFNRNVVSFVAVFHFSLRSHIFDRQFSANQYTSHVKLVGAA